MKSRLSYVINRRCPKCGKWGYVRRLDGDKNFMAKCTNCNHYIQHDELSLVELSTPLITNYDRLISKTPEEMAKHLTQAWYDGPVFECPARASVGVDRCAEVKDCEDCFLEWLKSPVEEVDNA